VNFEVIRTLEDVHKAIEFLSTWKKPWTVDIETSGTNPRRDYIVGFALAWKENSATYFPIRHRYDQPFDGEKVFEFMKYTFETNPFIAFNVPFDAEFLIYNAGIRPDIEKAIDVSLLTYTNGRYPANSLKVVTKVEFPMLNVQGWREFMAGQGLKGQATIAEAPIDEVAKYCGTDAIATLCHFNKLYPKLKENRVYKLEQMLLPIVMQLRANGVLINKKYFQKEQEKLKEEVETLQRIIEAEVCKKVGTPVSFNIASSQQLGKVLFDEVGIPFSKVTPGGQRCVSKRVLEGLKWKYPIVHNIISWKEMQKRVSTYYKTYIDFVESDGRIHASYNQSGVPSGRFSCSDPNLQNIPRRSSWNIILSDSSKRKVVVNTKQGFRVPDDWWMLEADYSQIEARIAAGVTQEVVLLNSFKEGIDFHTKTASLIFKTSVDRVTKTQRYVGKCVHPEMLVFSEGIYMPIEDVKKGGSVADNVGLTSVVDKFESDYERECVVVFREGVFVCGEEHPILLKNGNLKKAKELVPKKDIIKQVYSYKLKERKNEKININPFTPDGGGGVAEIELNEKWAYLAGAFLGDGSCTRDMVVITVDRENKDFQKKLLQLGRSLGFSCSLHWGREKRNTGRAVALYLGSRRLRRFFVKLGLIGSHGRNFRIPSWVFRSRRNAWAFLSGLIDTDGSINDRHWNLEITQKDPVFMSQLSVLARALGLRVSFDPCFNKIYRRWYYRIRFPSKGRSLLVSNLRLLNGYKQNALLKWGKHVYVNNNRLGENIVLAVVFGEKRRFMDITVRNGDGLFWCGGLVCHNTLNFALIYGAGIQTCFEEMQKEMDISYGKVKEFRSRYLEVYPRMFHGAAMIGKAGVKNGYVETLFGRRIPIILHNPDNEQDVQAAMRLGYNQRVQGTAADIVKIGMIKVDRLIKKKYEPDKIRFILTTHDSLGFEIHKSVDLVSFCSDMKKELYYKRDGYPDIFVEFTLGRTWGTLEEKKKEGETLKDFIYRVTGEGTFSSKDKIFILELPEYGAQQTEEQVLAFRRLLLEHPGDNRIILKIGEKEQELFSSSIDLGNKDEIILLMGGEFYERKRKE